MFVFFSVIIFFINYSFILSPCIYICLMVGCVMFQFSVFCFNSISVFQNLVFPFGLLGDSCSSSSLFTCWHISSISRPENRPFLYHSILVDKSLVCCIKSSNFCLNFYYSFSILSLSRITLKWSLTISWLSSFDHFLRLCLSVIFRHCLCIWN